MTESEADWCLNHNADYTTYIYEIFYAIATISMIPFVYSYITAYFKKSLKAAKSLFYLANLFYVMIFTLYIVQSVPYAVYCYHPFILYLVRQATFALYSFSTLVLFIIFFERLTLIFRNTQLEVSVFTKRLFYGVWWLRICILINSITFYAMGSKYLNIYLLSAPIGSVITLFLIIWLNCLFIRKLSKFHVNEKGGDLTVDIITKTAFFTFISTFSTVLNFIIYFLGFGLGWRDTDVNLFVHGFMAFLDVETNFLSVFLVHRYYDKWYHKLCGCCHRKCKRFCNNKLLNELQLAQYQQDQTKVVDINIVNNGEGTSK